MQCTHFQPKIRPLFNEQSSRSLENEQKSKQDDRHQRRGKVEFEKLSNSSYTNDPTKEKGPPQRVEGIVALVVLQSKETVLKTLVPVNPTFKLSVAS